MDLQLADLLREIEESSRQHGEVPRIAREAGHFLNLLAKAARATRLLEVGTANGYATLWLAEAAAANDGLLTTIESNVWKSELAGDVLSRSPHADRINLMRGDVLELLPVMEGPFDFILLDADKSQTLHYFHILIEKISSGGLICCDKAMSMASTLTDYLSYVHERPGLESVLIPIGEGIEVTYKAP